MFDAFAGDVTQVSCVMDASLADVETWIFDLDNTLYRSSCGLFAQVDKRMQAYIADAVGVPLAEAARLQKQYYRDYGTTLRGLMSVHGLKPEPFLNHVEDIDLRTLKPDSLLRVAIATLPGRKLIYTNGSKSYAERVIAARGLDDLFEAVYDIVAASYEPKPRAAPLFRLLERHGIAPWRAAMVEDLARNLEVPHTLGMLTVLVHDDNHPDRGVIFDQNSSLPHIKHVTDDLARFLHSVGRLRHSRVS